MSGKLPGLSTRIAAEIAQFGSISFARFMELALYEPDDGYYSSGRASVGHEGDFYTNVSTGPVFGEILAGQFIEMWEAIGCPHDFTIVEQGANDGQLACDVLDALEKTPLANARFIIIEPFTALRTRQAEKLAGRTIKWCSTEKELPKFQGVHFSNELFDALPVHIVQSSGTGWTELRVTCFGNQFFWNSSHPEPEVALALEKFPLRPTEYLAEIRLSTRPLLQTLSEKITQGFLLAVDYGMSSKKLLASHRKEGTLSCYRKHRRDSNPLEFPGEKDITAHVNFSSLVEDAERASFHLEGFTDQHHFLVGAATKILKAIDGSPPTPFMGKKLRALQTLIHPESMGRQFHALLLSKNLAFKSEFSGFQHAKDPRQQLFEDAGCLLHIPD